jgi:hypothetical protein
VGVVGLGRAGGNLAAELAIRGQRALAVNVSESDLRGLPAVATLEKLCLATGRAAGTGGTRALGAELIGRAEGELAERLRSATADVDLVVAAGGLGGGTGGNLAALVRVIASLGRAATVVGVLPASSEAHHVKLNALEAVDELVEAPFESLVLVDNHKLFSAFGAAPLDRFLGSCNATFVDAFLQMIRVGADGALASIRSFDAQNLRRLFGAGGVLSFGRADLAPRIDHASLLEALLDIVNHNEALAGEHDLEDAVGLGTVVVADEAVLAATAASEFDAFAEEVRMVTGGGAHEIGIYRGPAGIPPELQVVVAGLALPSRVDALLREVGEEAERARSKQAVVKRKLKRIDFGALPESIRPKARATRKRPGSGAPEGTEDDRLPTLPPSARTGIGDAGAPAPAPAPAPVPRIDDDAKTSEATPSRRPPPLPSGASAPSGPASPSTQAAVSVHAADEPFSEPARDDDRTEEPERAELAAAELDDEAVLEVEDAEATPEQSPM